AILSMSCPIGEAGSNEPIQWQKAVHVKVCVPGTRDLPGSAVLRNLVDPPAGTGASVGVVNLLFSNQDSIAAWSPPAITVHSRRLHETSYCRACARRRSCRLRRCTAGSAVQCN